MKRRFQTALACAVTMLTACDQRERTGPPELRLGRDQCAQCGMIIMEDRCSSATLVEDRGRRSYRLFDDIGCMLDDLRENPAAVTVIDRFVHDHGTRAWIRAADAVFFYADPISLHTPMGTGIVAFAARADAQALHAIHGGEILDEPAISAARARRVLARQRGEDD
ncbi:MAG: nitrous oxide reductase accessory protein NosL [Phycisphaeraceae bacterium]|mgnify:CR=1 FL=1|nr:nitrous oxide reductase accessory protein NosL [Phycisphaerae bacterium]MBX3391694.1 nitrous oxide reductase accessory protein NosL [Phycisphaeraceae bacterium]HRJ48963.1 nitrous oxide reductase accessory protein NosL [Phycisphaerales bacterium]